MTELLRKLLAGWLAEIDQVIADREARFATINEKLDLILKAVAPPLTASVTVTLTGGGTFTIGENNMITVTMNDSQEFVISITNPKDAKGQPSQIDPSKTVFAIDNPALATLVPGSTLDSSGNVIAGDAGLQCVIQAQGVGTGTVSISVVDATVATDVVVETIALTITGGPTASIDVSTSVPVSH